AKAQREQVTVLQGTPTLWNVLSLQQWGGQASNFRVLCGGEPLEKATATRVLQISNKVWNLYGPTETTIWSAAYRVENLGRGTVPIGKPVANTQMYVLDGEMIPVPVGVAGDLYIGGDGLA